MSKIDPNTWQLDDDDDDDDDDIIFNTNSLH
jgi:hypothetical protein